MPPTRFLSTQDWSRPEIDALLALASELKGDPRRPFLTGKAVGLLFFNPSLRTRTSMEIGVWQAGGHAVVLEPGGGSWPIAFEDGAVMDGEAEEHVREAARVLSSYCDLIAVRRFPGSSDWSKERLDAPIRAFAEHATVPVMNLETIEHPCQELAHAATLRERLGSLQNKKYVLTWAPHPRPLNTAVANSSLLIATKLGMDVTLLCPDDRYLLDGRYLEAAAENASTHGGSFGVSHDIDAAYAGADVVYAKSWGAMPVLRQLRNAERRDPVTRTSTSSWTRQKMALHQKRRVQPLPADARRNVQSDRRGDGRARTRSSLKRRRIACMFQKARDGDALAPTQI